MPGLTDTTQISHGVNNFYDRTLLERAVALFLHTRWAQVRDIPGKSETDTIKFRRYSALAANTTALTEGVTPAGKQLSKSDITAQIQYYGDYVEITDKLQFETVDPILTEAADILGEQAADSLDELCRDVLNAGTTIQYAGAADSRATVDADMKMDRGEVKEAIRTLSNNETKTITKLVDASNNYNTAPIGACFIGIVHPYTTFDLEDAEGWTPVENYANKKDVMEGEKGKILNVRFVETTNAKTFTGTLVTTVYSTLIFGRNAYGVTRLSGHTMRNIVKALGSAGTADPLDQRATSGWKASFVAKILNENWILRVEHAVSD